MKELASIVLGAESETVSVLRIMLLSGLFYCFEILRGFSFRGYFVQNVVVSTSF